MSAVYGRHRAAAQIGVAGSILGIVAGVVQATIGSRIPEWSGAKAAPIALGLLTVGLSALAGWAALAQRSPRSVWGRAGCALALIGPGLLCLSTVGRLWYLPSILLVVAGILTVDSWRATGRAVADDWFRVLLSALGGFEILMAAGSSPVLMVVGTLSGIVLVIAAWQRSAPRSVSIRLIAVGTLPFAILAWTAVVPVLLVLVAALVATPIVRQRVPAAIATDAAAGASAPLAPDGR